MIYHITNVVSGANLREEFEITALFHIPKKYPCSYAFAQMEQAKKELLIDDYSITQTSLEQVRNRNIISSPVVKPQPRFRFSVPRAVITAMVITIICAV